MNKLHRAARSGSLSTVAYLLKIGYDVHAMNVLGETPLLCADYTKPKIIKALLQAGARIDVRGDYLKRQPLHLAVIAENAKSVELLLDAGADVQATDACGSTPLRYAVLLQKEEVVRALVKNGARVEFEDILPAGMDKNVNLVGYLLRRTSPSSVINEKTSAELMIIVSRCVTDARLKNTWTRRILDYSDVSTLNKVVPELRSFPIVAALYTGTAKQVEMMFDEGVDVHMQDTQGNNFLHLAAHFLEEDAQKVKVLLSRGVRVNQRNSFNATPLMYALHAKSAEVVKLIFDRGGDFEAKDINGHSVMCYLAHRSDINSTREALKYITPVIYKKDTILKTGGEMYAVKDDKLREYEQQCRKELDELRSRKFYNDVTLLDILLKSVSELTSYTRNDELVVAFDRLARYEKEYPIYGSWLAEKFAAALERREQVDSVADFLSDVFQLYDPMHVVNMKIIGYLSDHDLMVVRKGLSARKKRKFSLI